MGINTSRKKDEKTSKEFLNYTGIFPYKILAVNPDLAELKKMGINYITQEPVYISNNQDGDKQALIRFYLTNGDFKYKDDLGAVHTIAAGTFQDSYTVYITKKVWVGKNSGKTQFVNKYGKVRWGSDKNDIGEYFKPDGIREAYRGEEDLYKFFFAWANLKYDTTEKVFDECILENIETLFEGDFSEIKNYTVALKDNMVKLLRGLFFDRKGEKAYIKSRVYPKCFQKFNMSTGIEKYIEEDTSQEQYNKFKNIDYYTYTPTALSRKELEDLADTPDTDSLEKTTEVETF